MRKGTKKIRHVDTGSKEYYVYDLDMDEHGKRKRLYASTVEELENKIKLAEQERERIIASNKSQSRKLSECIKYYFKSTIGKIPVSDIKRLVTLFDNAITDSKYDKDIDNIAAEDIQSFINRASEVYHYQSVVEMRTYLKNVFDFYEQSIDFDNITIDENVKPVSCIVSPSEYDTVIEYCLIDNCTKFGKNELLFLFCLFTGLPFSKAKQLNKSDFDFESNRFTIGDMTYPMDERTASWIKEQMLKGTLGEEPLFINRNMASPSLQSIQTTVDGITRRLGLPQGLTSRTITKSYIVWRLQNGATAQELTEYFAFEDKSKISDIYDEYKVRTALFR